MMKGRRDEGYFRDGMGAAINASFPPSSSKEAFVSVNALLVSLTAVGGEVYSGFSGLRRRLMRKKENGVLAFPPHSGAYGSKFVDYGMWPKKKKKKSTCSLRAKGHMTKQHLCVRDTSSLLPIH